MAKGYNLTVQLNLQGPSNVNSVVNNLKKQLSGINANVNVQLPNNAIRQIAQVNKSLKQTAKDANVAASGMEKFGQAAGLAVKRFGAFTAATAGFYAITRATQQSLQKFVEFDKQITRIAQVTNSTKQSLSGLSSEITKLSVSLGASSSELAAVSVTLSQAGLSARETEKALKALALTTLAPTFNNLNQTVEGSIALMKQFSISTSQLEKALGSINAVAGSFAVEAGDLITAVQRAGGVFAAASTGVSTGTQALNEFLAVFTSVRATTRESAETIATGLRTIFTRLQRADTIAALEAFGVTLTDLEGKFVGPYRAIEQLAKGLGRLDPRSLQFSGIVEELGGFRQVGKVIPLIQRFTTAQQALNVAQAGSGSLAKDAAIGQQALSVQVAKVAEEFNALIRSIGQTGEFRAFVRLSLDLASALIKVADAIKPVIPALAALGAARLVGGLGQIGRGFRKGIGFNSGGLVPGSGNTDSVSANLTPGEYVIRKKAVQAIGVGNLERMNRYAKGGPVSPDSMGSAEIRSRIVRTGKAEQYAAGQRINAGDRVNLDIQSIAFDGGKVGNTQFEKRVAASLRGQWFGGNAPVDVVAPGYGPVEVRNRSKFTPPAELADKLARYKLSTIGEAALSNQMQNDNINLGRIYVAYNTGKLPKEELDKKKLAGKKIRSLDRLPKNAKKVGYDFRPQPITRAASGGPISGKDTVPALLTPGEYVLNERAASMLGEKTLNELNNADKIYGYNSGGPVRLQGGGRPSGGGGGGGGGDTAIGKTVGVMLALQGAVSGLSYAIGDASASALAAQNSLQGLATAGSLSITALQILPKNASKLSKGLVGVLGVTMALDSIIQSVGNSTNQFNAKLGKETLSKTLDAAGKNLEDFSKNVRNAAAAAQFSQNIEKSIQAAKTVGAAESGRSFSLRQFAFDYIAGQGSSGRGSEYEAAASRVRARGGVLGGLSELFNPSQFAREVEAELSATRSASTERFGSIRDQLLRRSEIQVGAGANLRQVYQQLTESQREAIARSNADISRQIDAAGGADTAAGKDIINQEVIKQLKISLGPALAARTASAAERTAKQLQVALERVFSTMQQSMKAVAADINSRFARVTSSLSASLGQAKIGYSNTAMQNVLTNPRAFSAAQIASVVQKTTPLLGRGGDRVGQLAVASTQIESNIAGVIDDALSQGGLDPGAQLSRIGADLVNMVSGLNLGADIEGVISSQLNEAFERASKQLGENADPGEIRQKVQEIVSNLPSLNGALDVVRQAFETVSGAQQNYASVVQQVTDAILSQKTFIDKAASIRREGDLQLRKALGEDISLNDVIRNVGAAVAQQTGGTTSIDRMSQNIQTLLARRSQIEERRSQIGGSAVDSPEWKALTDELSKLDVELANSRAGLELLANSTEIASAALGKVAEIQARASQQIDFTAGFATSGPEQLASMERNFAALNHILEGGQLTLQNSFDAQQAMFQTAMQGGSAGDVYLAGRGALASQQQATLGLLTQLKPFVGDSKEFNQQFKTVLTSFLKQRAQGPLGQKLLASLDKMFAQQAGQGAEQKQAIAVYQQAIDAQARANEALGQLPQPMTILAEATNALNSTIRSLPDKINKMIPGGVSAPVAQGKSSGGIVYASNGQYVEMKPKGTDTVPAMLTEGEFVVNRKATKKNRALLETINNGGTPSMMGGVAYAADGGIMQQRYQQAQYVMNTGVQGRFAQIYGQYRAAYGLGVQRVVPIQVRRVILQAVNRENFLAAQYASEYDRIQASEGGIEGFEKDLAKRQQGRQADAVSAYRNRYGTEHPSVLLEQLKKRFGPNGTNPDPEKYAVIQNARNPADLYKIAKNYKVSIAAREAENNLNAFQARQERAEEAEARRREEKKPKPTPVKPTATAAPKPTTATVSKPEPVKPVSPGEEVQREADKEAERKREEKDKKTITPAGPAPAAEPPKPPKPSPFNQQMKVAIYGPDMQPDDIGGLQAKASMAANRAFSARSEAVKALEDRNWFSQTTDYWLGENFYSDQIKTADKQLDAVRRARSNFQIALNLNNAPQARLDAYQTAKRILSGKVLAGTTAGPSTQELQAQEQQISSGQEIATDILLTAAPLPVPSAGVLKPVGKALAKGAGVTGRVGLGAARVTGEAAVAAGKKLYTKGGGKLAAVAGKQVAKEGTEVVAKEGAEAAVKLTEREAAELARREVGVNTGRRAIGAGGAPKPASIARPGSGAATDAMARGYTETLESSYGTYEQIANALLFRSRGGIVPAYMNSGGYAYASPSDKIKDKYNADMRALGPDDGSQVYAIKKKMIAYGFGLDAAGRPVLNNPLGGYGDPRSNEKDYSSIFNDGNTPVKFNYLSVGGLAKGTDQYPAMLSKGEMVMNPEATRRNKGLLRALNKSRGGMVKNGIVYAANGTDGGLGVTAGNGELRITGDVRVTPENIPEPTAISAGASMAAPVGPAADTGGMEQMGSVLQEAFNSFGQNVSNIASPLTAFAGGAENLQNVFTVFNNAVTLMSSVNFGVISEGAQALQIAGNALSIASSSFVAPINGFRNSIASFAEQTNRLITAIATMGQVNGTIQVVGSISLQPLQVDVVGVDGLVEAISGPITNAVLAQVGNALSAGNPGINVDGLNVGSIV